MFLLIIVYKVLSYMFIHKSMSALVCNVAMLWYFGGAMERDIGTVKFAYLTLLLAILAGIIYLMIGSIIFGLDNLKGIQGFTVVVFSFVGLSVSLSPMKSVVFITTIKVIYLPFILLALSLFIPESSILGNICGIGAGVLCILYYFAQLILNMGPILYSVKFQCFGLSLILKITIILCTRGECAFF